MKFNSFLGRFRLVAIAEGISYLLFAITMPLKYILDIPEPNFIVGAAHGILFILYGLLALNAIFRYKWGLKKALIVLVASLIPVGTFYVDMKILKSQQELQPD